MIERHVTFNLHAGLNQDFEKFMLERYLPAIKARPGAFGAWLMREMQDPSRYHLVLGFETLQSAQDWKASDSHRELSPILKTFYATSEVVVYELVAQ